jgi:UDP-N-acetylglucosamine 2-epimerase (non-hydrolysing)
MRAVGRINPLTVASGQHPTMFHQGLAAFGLRPDIDIGLHRNRGDQAELAARLIEELDRKMAIRPPAGVVVQGDTSTALITALIAFWRSVPVVHLEAGLRSHDLSAPFPEEANRRLIDQIASLHLAPTPSAAANLNAEGVRNEGVIVTGNTIVDAVLAVAGRPERLSRAALRAVADRVEQGRRLLLVTVHRRESWGAPMREILTGVAEILARYPDVEVVLPMHPNPAVRADVAAVLGGNDRALLTEPLDYPDLVGLLRRATLVLSDSGGIQEEAPTFRVPVLVLREVTERTEAVDAGCALLLGTERARIVATTAVLLDDDEARAAITSGGNPFGDGFAAQRAEQAVAWLFGLEPRRPVNFDPAPVGPSVSLARQ